MPIHTAILLYYRNKVSFNLYKLFSIFINITSVIVLDFYLKRNNLIGFYDWMMKFQPFFHDFFFYTYLYKGALVYRVQRTRVWAN